MPPSSRRPRWSARLATALALAVVALVGCSPGAASTTGCEAFQAWQDRGFPRDLASPSNGPRYLTFLARVADEAPLAADDAEVVLRSAQEIHAVWIAAGGPDGPESETTRAAARQEQLWTAEVEAAAARIRHYGAETCGIVVP